MNHVKSWRSLPPANNLFNWASPLGPSGYRFTGSASPPEFAAISICTVDGVLRNLSVVLLTAPGSGESWTYQIWKKPVGGAWAVTSVVLTISGTNTTGNSGSAEVSVATGDQISLRVSASSTSAVVADSFVGLDYESLSTGQSCYGTTTANSTSSTAVRYTPLFPVGLQQWQTAIADPSVAVSPIHGTLSRWEILLETAPGGATSYTFALYKNGVKQDGSASTVDTRITVTGSATSGVATFNLPMVPGDLFYAEVTPSGSPATTRMVSGVRLVAVTDGESIQWIDQRVSLPTSSGAVLYKGTEYNTNYDSTEANVETGGVLTAFGLKDLYVNQTAAPGGDDGRTYSLRRNLSPIANGPSVSINGSQTTGSDTKSATISAGDTWDLRVENTNNGAVIDATARFAFVQFFGAQTDPVVQTLPASGIQQTQARIRGQLDPAGIAYSGYFLWGTNPDNLTNITAFQSVGSGDLFVPFDVIITGLLPVTTYYFQAFGDAGTSPDIFGQVLSFTTLGEQVFVDGEVSHPLPWIELTKRDAETKAFAEVDLNDPPDYYHGYKAPFVERFLPISRGLSDRDGQIQHMTFGAFFSDITRYFRSLLENSVNKYLTNRPLVVRFIDDEQRRVQGLPRLQAVGFVNNYSPRPDLRFEIEGSDWLKKKFSRKVKAQQSWQPLITADDFENCPEENLNIAAPLIYGALGLTGSDPVLDVTITVNAQADAAPTGFTGSLQSGGQYAGVTKHYKVAALIGGKESAQAGPLVFTTTATNKTVRLQWNAYASADNIVVYSSLKADFSQFILTVLAGNATQFDDEWTPINHLAPSTFGPWEIGLRLNLTYYVYAALGGGIFSLPGQASTFIAPLYTPSHTPIEAVWDYQERDVDIAWSEHDGAVDGYRVIRRRSYYSDWNAVHDRQFDVPASGSPQITTVNDDLITRTEVTIPEGELLAASASGQAEAISVGQMGFGSPDNLLNVLLISRCACKRVGNIYLPVTIQNVDGEDETTYQPVPESDFGSTWFAPDHGGWLYANKYVDINGRRYTLIATTLSPLPEKVLVDVDGIETDGDGEGELLTSIVDQCLHFTNNFLAPDEPYQSGAYKIAADTTFPQIPTLPLVDESSYHNVKAMLDERLVGGYVGATIIGAGGEFVSALDARARFHVSGDFDQCFNRKGQDAVTCEPVSANPDPPEISDVMNIQISSLSITDLVQTAFFNILPYVHTRDYTGRTKIGWYGSGDVRSQESIDNYDQERESPRWEFHCLRANSPQALATITDVLARKLARYRDPLRIGGLIMPYEALDYEPGLTGAVTSVEGIGASGWSGREVRFTHHEVEPTDGTVRLEFYDLTAVLENQGSP